MSDERIEINQPFRLILTCYKDGVIVDLATTTTQSIEYRDPSGTEVKVTASVLNPPGTNGKIYYDFVQDDINKINLWKAKPWLTFAGLGEIPGDPVDVEIYDEWESKE